jgi:septum formation protein
MPVPNIILASASARRRLLLQQIGVVFDVMVVDIDESLRGHESPEHYAQRLAEEKTHAGFEQSTKQLPVLGADTTVVIDGQVLGKPCDEQHAIGMLMKLSGKTHRVITGVSIMDRTRRQSLISVTEVSFAPFSSDEARAYWQTGEAHDKAGAYAIQGLAAVWVREIKGSFSGVMGLPLYETAQLLKSFNIPIGSIKS